MTMKDSFAENYWDSIKGHESSQENLCEFEEKNKDCPGLITWSSQSMDFENWTL